MPSSSDPGINTSHDSVELADDEHLRLLLSFANRVKQNEDERHVLSTSEGLAVALILNRADWLAEAKYTIPEAVDRVGAKLVAVLRRVERSVNNANQEIIIPGSNFPP